MNSLLPRLSIYYITMIYMFSPLLLYMFPDLTSIELIVSATRLDYSLISSLSLIVSRSYSGSNIHPWIIKAIVTTRAGL